MRQRDKGKRSEETENRNRCNELKWILMKITRDNVITLLYAVIPAKMYYYYINFDFNLSKTCACTHM